MSRKKVTPEAQENLDETRLHEIIVRFSLAMKNAHYPYIAEHEKMTEGMRLAWNSYVAWCQETGRFLKSNKTGGE